MDFVSTVRAPGTLKPNESVVVTPEVDGIIESLNVTQDQFVNEGDILLTIKNDELDQAVRSAEQQISQARNELTQANAALSAANSSYRSKQAAASVPIPDPTDPTNPAKVTYPEFDEAAAEAEITAAQGQVSAAELAVQNAQTAYDNAVAQANKRTVYAPTSGTVVALTAQVGAPVGGSGKSGLMQIADVSKMRVTVQVNEVDISTILVGQKADVTFNAVPDATLEAEVVNIASVATGMEGDASAGGSSSVANFAVDLLISTPDLRLKPGMTANVAIRTIEVPGAIVAPAAAVTDNGDGTGSVQRVINEETKETETVSVRLGNKGSGVVVITEGLSAGDKLLVQGSASTDATTEAAAA
jgi:HlyD family secretion protein